MSDTDDGARWDAVVEATELLRDGEWADAERELHAVLDRDPANAYAKHYLGQAREMAGDTDGAHKAFVEAERLSPTYLGAVLGVGRTLRALGRLDESARTLERALALRAEDPDALYLLGLVHSERGDRKRAIECLERFIATRPEVEAKFDAEALVTALKGKAGRLESV